MSDVIKTPKHTFGGAKLIEDIFSKEVCEKIREMTGNKAEKESKDPFADLDPNTWEADCSECGTYYTGTFKPEERKIPETICPNCGSDRCCFGSPAGGKFAFLSMDF